ncbi:MAG TPA: DUF4148 domain-containing protein [Pararobbsia sp.]|nr:DUF4148 domain-containing protein [Pararobbsia sp.]
MTARIRIVGMAAALALLASFGWNAEAMAQDEAASTAGAAVSASGDKAAARAQRKAARKAARAKKNAELSEIEKNGANPGAPKITAPANTVTGESKAIPPAPPRKKKGPMAASAASVPQ